MRTPLPLILALACCVLAAVLGATLLTVRIEQRAIEQKIMDIAGSDEPTTTPKKEK